MSHRSQTQSNDRRCANCERIIRCGVYCAKGRGCRKPGAYPRGRDHGNACKCQECSR